MSHLSQGQFTFFFSGGSRSGEISVGFPAIGIGKIHLAREKPDWEKRILYLYMCIFFSTNSIKLGKHFSDISIYMQGWKIVYLFIISALAKEKRV